MCAQLIARKKGATLSGGAFVDFVDRTTVPKLA
jgi:hypothetical protein